LKELPGAAEFAAGYLLGGALNMYAKRLSGAWRKTFFRFFSLPLFNANAKKWLS
jgi:hypothetical protein